MSLNLPTSNEQLADLCNRDGEFKLAARFWNGALRLLVGDRALSLQLNNGIAAARTLELSGDVISISGPAGLWELLLAQTPPRFCNDIAPLMRAGMTVEGNITTYAQYYPAIMRMIELLRPPAADQPVSEAGQGGRHDAPTGRYIHLELEGQDYRIYYEEAGRGIPLLLQHTAGCHGAQWRHLFEVPEITDRFRLIAYDLPFHGKSLPPIGRKWWAEEYKLTGRFARSLPLALAHALELDRPVFMGCSVGGVLALDLAYHHPDEFRAVISLEGSLRIADRDHEGAEEQLALLWHPQVSNEFKARAMNALMSPTAPEAYRKETSQVYSAGWPPAFLGDLHYYSGEYDLRGKAQDIDTRKVAVHILSGEYDFSGTLELGREAHQAIRGSSFTPMDGMGHFPMSEDPQRFIQYLLPTLDQIAITAH